MQPQRYAAALLVIAACRIPEMTYHKPDDAGIDEMPDMPRDMAIDMFIDLEPSMRPSCRQLDPKCGAAQDSCCTSPTVPGGTFYRDYDASHSPPSDGMDHFASVNDFRLDKYDVTVGRFRQFVLAGKGTKDTAPAQGDGAHKGFAASGWDTSWNANLEADTTALIAAINCSTDQTWHNVPRSPLDETRPMNCLTWYEAMAFCIWDGGYLPSEAEWNYAALGGDEQRAYPWSMPPSDRTIDETYVSYSPTTDNCTGDGMPGCVADDIIPVGILPKSNGRWGHADLAGNLYQWSFDWSVNPYPPAACTGGCPNWVKPDEADPLRVMRGGAFVYPANQLRGAFRANLFPWRRQYITGLRCARDAPPM